MKKYSLLPAVVLFMLTASSLAFAGGGTFLFIYGDVYVQTEDQAKVVVRAGDKVNSGDLIVTNANGRAQLRMDDGGLIALRPNTEFLIESFYYAGDEASDSPEAEDDSGARQSHTFFKLLKGGFRSVTGAIAKQDPSSYRVTTPVATIGIRGTDYTAFYCEEECELPEAGGALTGLFVDVSEGQVVVRNDQGILELNAGDQGVVGGTDLPPQMVGGGSTSSDALNSGGSNVPAAEAPAMVVDEQGNPLNLTSGSVASSTTQAAVSYAVGSANSVPGYSGVNSDANDSVTLDANGSVIGWHGLSPDGDADFSVSSSLLIGGADENRDEATGLRWGRWAGGSMSVVSDPSTVVLDLDNTPVHWIRGPEQTARPELPTTGSMHFDLIGNTSPTDNVGHVGTLGSASLDANFTSQTVDASVDLSIDQHTWEGNAVDIPIDQADATFQGAFDQVTVTNTQVINDVQAGSGELSGFFIGNEASGAVSGAGMTYSMQEGDVSVSGAAAFQAQDGTP